MKIEDLNKRNIHKVPEGYFDELPGKIQKKIEAHNKPTTSEWTFWLKVATPVAATLFIIAFFLFRTPESTDSQLSSAEILNEVSSEELISYLELTDISSEEILNELESETIEELEMTNEELILDEEIGEEELEALFEEYNLDV